MYSLGPSLWETVLDAGTTAGSDTADTVPDRPHTRDTALHSQTANRYTSSPWMVLSVPLLCWIGLYTVWGIQGNHPTGFFGLHHKPQNPVESAIFKQYRGAGS